MRKIKSRISLLTRFRPPACLALESHFQYSRKPARCQPTTVLGVTTTRGRFHPDQSFLKTTQKQFVRGRESTARSFGVQSKQLLTQSEIFEDEIRARAECTNKPSEEMSERCD